MNEMLVEIHGLQNHAPSNLNRDDSGSPKDCYFGGYQRARVSSQCIKRAARQSSIFKAGMEEIGMGIRTRMLPEIVKDALLNNGVPDDVAIAASSFVTMIGKSRKKSKGKKKPDEKDDQVEIKSGDMQIMFFSKGEIDMITSAFVDAYDKCKTIDDVKKVDFDAVLDTIEKSESITVTPDIAMFGRMITSNAFRDIEASVQVAHAISTNVMEHEFDYFTAVDDILSEKNGDGEKGAGMIGDVEFTSSCYYKYVNIDTDAFSKNIDEKDGTDVLARTMKCFLRALFLVSPSGKQNTFAAHQLPDAILVEIRPEKIPVSYANAFLKPAKPHGNKDLVDDSIDKLVSHASMITRKFSLPSSKRLWFSTRDINVDGADTIDTMDDLIDTIVETVIGA